MHLTEEEIKDFVLEELSVEAEIAVDSHLESCVECSQQLEDFYTAQEQFPAAQWAARREAFVASLREQIFGPKKSAWEGLREFLGSFRCLISDPEFAFDTKRQPADFKSDDETFGVFIAATDDGNVIVSFDTSEMELAGTAIRFRAGKWSLDAPPLSKISDDRVGTDIAITKEELAAMPKETALTVEPID
jgi:hypothetical protein